jgi:hypothetical protein
VNSEPRRRGRRDNGLDAAAYVPLADVDPRVGEHLLDVLWAAGVPAYLEPASDIQPTRAVIVPSPPTDRLWVDSNRRADAWTVIRADTPTAASWPNDEPAPAKSATAEHDRTTLADDEELAWKALVDDFERADERSTDSTAPLRWPAAEDIDPSSPDSTDRSERAGGSVTASRPATPPGRPAPGPRDYVPPTDDEVSSGSGDDDEHFHPPAPPPLPRLSYEAIGALLLIAAGIFLLVAPGMIGMSGDQPFGLGVLGIIAGAGLLVWRLRADRSDDDPEDGAIV